MADDTDTLASLDGRLAATTAAADRFGSALTGALRAAVIEGRSLDAVLQKLVLQLSDAALSAALKPLSSLLSGLAGAAVGGLGSILSGTAGLAGATGSATAGTAGLAALVAAGTGSVAAPAGFPEVPTAAAPSDANAPAAGAAGAVAVTFNVRTPDAASFRASEAQLGRMLARAVGRGRRGL